MTNKITETSWHTMQIDEVIGNLDTNVNAGLNLTEVEDRLKKYGHNQLEEKEGVSPIMLFLGSIQRLHSMGIDCSRYSLRIYGRIGRCVGHYCHRYNQCHYWIYSGIPRREIPCCITKNVPVGGDKPHKR